MTSLKGKAATVTDAVISRRSLRAFLSDEVSIDLLEDMKKSRITRINFSSLIYRGAEKLAGIFMVCWVLRKLTRPV